MNEENNRKTGLLAIVGPGLLVAATGVGAGDLATGALAGSKLGVAILWAVIVGAFLKFVLNEGLARWQLATGSTVLEGTAKHIGRWAVGVFLLYLIVWSFFVGAALMSACGVAVQSLLPMNNPDVGKQAYGVIQSLVAVVLIWMGGYKLFGRVMGVCIAAMFVIVLVNTIAVKPDWFAVARGSFLFAIPTPKNPSDNALQWTIGLMGGVGGTVTVLCYGYWIREERRQGLGELKNCRIDLMTGYIATALFGMCMVILGQQLNVGAGKGAGFLVQLAAQLESELGSLAKYAFLTGAWGAVFSSMLGVWQSVPYLFDDSLKLLSSKPRPARDGNTTNHRIAMLLIASIPAIGLFTKFEKIQLAYAVVGALFLPLLALALIFLNGSEKRIGTEGKNARFTNVVLVGVVLAFAFYGYLDAQKKLAPKKPNAARMNSNYSQRIATLFDNSQKTTEAAQNCMHVGTLV